MRNWQLADAGFAYDVVAVFGSQSTGKSTLLNRLFGTKFDVMNENERRQTTKGKSSRVTHVALIASTGIWMSKGQDMPVLVMDVEGTDGRERGEDQDFERKSALFSMATAEVLLVNIWEHQVGLYQGANMGLLKTVFEVNLGLFLAAKDKGKEKGSAQDKTLLLFVIRDHIGATPLANLRATLTADLNRLWDGLSKPPGLESSQISTFFDLEFVALPHKLLQPEQFEEGVKALRKRFVKGGEDSVFKEEYHKRIPADGISAYMGSIWDAVVSNKDLDLPTQQELLAQFRCDEIAALAFAQFADLVKAFPPPAGVGKIVEGLGERMREAREAALSRPYLCKRALAAAYDAAASRYHAAVYARQRVELLSKLHATLHPLFLSHLKNLHKLVLRTFRQSIEHALRTEGYDFARVVQGAREKAEGTFEKEAREVELKESGWSASEQRGLLEEDMDSVAELLRKEETRKMVAVIERNIKRQVTDVVELSLTEPSPDMWDKVLSAFKTTLGKSEEAYLQKAMTTHLGAPLPARSGFNCSSSENDSALTLLRRRAWLVLRGKIDEHTTEQALLVKLKGVFEDKFRYDNEGVPRVWKPEDDIDAIFKKARDGVLDLVPLYASIKPVDTSNEFTLPPSSPIDAPTSAADLDDFDFPASLLILTPSQQAALSTRFKRESDAYYLEAKRSMVASRAQIPYWIYGVLAVLGWNEFVAVIRSPVYFTMLLLLGAAAYVTWSLNMTGPVIAVARGVSNEVIRTVNEQLHNYFTAQSADAHASRNHRQPVPVPASTSNSTDEIELEEKKARIKDE
ncbi:SPOSA6832_01887 [Sporobolomyces salmonicolor]|uniref:SPOSA6832_01887-mRNA-1:cds n=1 Tax=Sporidiobolus salmonicolor TaxID=5005 RepID=A0A0D6EKM5_SPOSA|nr:SPOSA6832_01887 [Sporobolomyces salmonicolor]